MAEFLVRAVPSPEFHQRMHPQVEMIDGHVGPDVPHLLLARAPDFLDVVEVLFDRSPVGEGFHNLDQEGREGHGVRPELGGARGQEGHGEGHGVRPELFLQQDFFQVSGLNGRVQ